MNSTIQKLSLFTLIALFSLPLASITAQAQTNLKSSSGKPVGNLDAKFFRGFKKTQKPQAAPLSGWPKDWKWEHGVDSNKSLFNQLDANTDGSITKEEFRAKVRNKREDEVFTALDKNKNKSISRSELDKFNKN